MRKSAIARGILGVSIGLPLSLIIGTGASYLPNSPVEGLFAGVVVSSVLFVAVLVLLSRTRGPRPLKKWLFDLHTFVGLAIGFFLIVLVSSGVPLLFRGEIEAWSHGWLKVQPGAHFTSVDAWLDAVSRKTNLDSVNRVDVAWPKSSTSPAEIRVAGREGSRTFHVDPYRNNLLQGEMPTWMNWIRELHTNLHMQHLGGFLAGLTGLGAVWMVVSGLLMRGGLFRDWRLLRFHKGTRVLASDLHMRIAIWLFPFVAVMAYSGMLLAFSAVLTAGPVRVLFGGSQNSMYAALGFPQKAPRSEPASMPPLELFTKIVQNEMPGAAIHAVRVIGFGDRNAIVSVYASRPGDLVPKGTSLIMNFRAATNEVLNTRRIDGTGLFERFHAAMVALHVANFDRMAVRIIYAGASIVSIFLPIVGLVIWFLRRRDPSGGNHERPSRAIP